MSAQDLTPEDFDRLAAEHVLGLLDADEEVRAAALVKDDPAFRAAVEDWRARFAELDATALPLEAPDALLARISATLDATPAAAPEAEVERARLRSVETPAGTAARPATLPPLVPSPAGAFSALWRNLGFWRFASFAGAAATVLLALGVIIGPLGRGPAPAFVAVLMSPQGEPAAVVNAFADGTAELIPLRTIPVPEGRTLEVWTLWDPARGPVSIGLTGEARTIRLNLRDLPRTAPNQLFEITLEPQGGSPVGRPTGPVLMKGTTSVAL
ncbi:anti-sigma factor [Aquabacter sp. CN5-332]|uniref:anti-sigma factor n=1 Tax=Aquabacter sp. CN5-332 TaxID=3156608 RepID=UPI0032B344FB